MTKFNLDLDEHAAACVAAAQIGPEPGELVLSIRQPFAWLAAGGYKIVENRSWTTPHRGLVWIHASQAVQAPRKEAIDWMKTDGGLRKEDAARYKDVTSAVIGCVWLADVFDAVKSPPPFLTGNIHAGRSAFWWWFSAAALLAEPVEAAGKLKLWKW